MWVLGLDLETTGLQAGKDRITEIGWILWETNPTSSEAFSPSHFVEGGMTYLYEPTYPEISEFITSISTNTTKLLRRLGKDPSKYLPQFRDFVEFLAPTYIVGHNGVNFDKQFIEAEFRRYGVELGVLSTIPWIDTKHHLSHKSKPASGKLIHLCADYKINKVFDHRALFDTLATLQLLSKFTIEDVVGNVNAKYMVVWAKGITRETKDVAKSQYYGWKQVIDGVDYGERWVKKIKVSDLDEERKKIPAPFEVVALT
jgi:DNA polymerase III epsilon subunit-like protein